MEAIADDASEDEEEAEEDNIFIVDGAYTFIVLFSFFLIIFIGDEVALSSHAARFLEDEDELTSGQAEEIAAFYQEKYSRKHKHASEIPSTYAHSSHQPVDLHNRPGAAVMLKTLRFPNSNDPFLYQLSLRPVGHFFCISRTDTEA